ncbi:MAG: CBS domain-containing protein [Candidatus Caldarchaeum sp.]
MLIGMFVYIGATEEAEQTILSTALARVRVKDIVYQDAVSVKPDSTLSDALEVMFESRYHDALIADNGVLKGVVTWHEIIKVRSEQSSELKVSDLPIKHV